ncbi:MAG: ZIP family metal transporter, partial [Desulfobacterales bacterium]
MTQVWIAFGLTLFAGMATGIGSLIAFTAKRTNYRFLSVATGFSAGVMLYVSFVEIFFKGAESLTIQYGDYWAHWVNAASFFGGILLIGVIDNLIPASENPHEPHSEELTAPLHNPLAPVPEDYHAACQGIETGLLSGPDYTASNSRLMRMGLFTALAIGIHNFPEGLATFLAALQDPKVG